MRYRDLIESKSSPLFHGTSLVNAEQILDSDTFYTSFESSSEGQVSLTRTFGVAAQFAMYSDVAGVIFFLDQERLSRQLGKNVKPFNANPDDDWEWEHEEAASKDIKNASSIITKIVVMQHEKFDPSEFPLIMQDRRTVVVPQADIEYINDKHGYQMTSRQFAQYMKNK